MSGIQRYVTSIEEAAGLYSVLVPDAEPRKRDRGFRARRRMGLEPRRRRLYWLSDLWAAA